jgi:hypothetical protein
MRVRVRLRDVTPAQLHAGMSAKVDIESAGDRLEHGTAASTMRVDVSSIQDATDVRNKQVRTITADTDLGIFTMTLGADGTGEGTFHEFADT